MFMRRVIRGSAARTGSRSRTTPGRTHARRSPRHALACTRGAVDVAHGALQLTNVVERYDRLETLQRMLVVLAAHDLHLLLDMNTERPVTSVGWRSGVR
jgi:hypothetical protein